MIDLHNHILPALDDGARDLAEAIAMARFAVEAGTTLLVATPHRFFRGREIAAATVVAHLGALQDEIDDRGIPLRLAPGSEIPFGPDVVQGLITGRLLRLGGSMGTHALIETPFEAIAPDSLTLLEQLFDAGIGVVLAHPERNAQVQSDLAFVESCAALGAVLQITSGSILGRFGPAAEAAARRIVSRSEWTVAIASDSHWAHDRTPNLLTEAAGRVAEWTGDHEAARRMIFETPASCMPAAYR